MADVKKVTTKGMNEILDNGELNFTYLAVGTGTLVPSESTTALTTEIDREIVGQVKVEDNVMTLLCILTNEDANGSLAEWGIFDAASSGNCLACGTWDPVKTKAAGEQKIVEIAITLANP